MRLGSLLYGGRSSPRTWSRVPDDLLDAAFVHCEQRAERARLDNARGRATATWIGTWLRHIAAEIERRAQLRRPKPPSHVTIMVGNATSRPITFEVATNVTRRS